MQDELKIDADLQTLHIYSPFKSPLSPVSSKHGSDLASTWGLRLCYRQGSDTSVRGLPTLPPGGRIAELFQDVPQLCSSQTDVSFSVGPVVCSAEGDGKGMEDVEAPGSFFGDDDSLCFAADKDMEVEMLIDEMRDAETTQMSRRPSWENPLPEEAPETPEAKLPVNKKKCCNCKKSKCLKLYCECFAAGESCEGCNCVGCHNLPEHNDERCKAISQIAKKNPTGLRRRTKLTKGLKAVGRNFETGTGCNCTKSGCLKNYCECFKIGVGCGASCTCEACKNTRGRSTNPGR